MRIVVSDKKTGKSYNVEVAKEMESALNGKKIGERIDGGMLGAAGFSFEITGGSDKSGFPMRRDVPGGKKARLLLSKGVGFRATEKGERRRMLVRGNAVSADIIQLNTVVMDYGTADLTVLFPPVKKEEKK